MSNRGRQVLNLDKSIVDYAQALVDDLAIHIETAESSDGEKQDMIMHSSLRRLQLLELEATDPKIISITAYLITVTPERVPDNPFPDEDDDFTGLLDAVRGALAARRPDLAVALGHDWAI